MPVFLSSKSKRGQSQSELGCQVPQPERDELGQEFDSVHFLEEHFPAVLLSILEGEPKPEQMSPEFGVVLVFEGTTGMDNVVVAQELNVSWLELHGKLDSRIIGNLVINLDRLQCRRIDFRHEVVVPHRSIVAGVPEGLQIPLVVAHGPDGHVPGASVAAGIQVEILVESRDEVWSPFEHLVVDSNTAGDPRRTSFLSRCQTQQTDHIGSIAVEEDVFIGAVLALVQAGRVLPMVFITDVAQKFSTPRLGTRNAQQLTQGPKEELRLMLGPPMRRHSSHYHKAKAIVPPRVQLITPRVDFGNEPVRILQI